MRLIRYLLRRWHDYQRERRIRWLCNAYVAAMAHGRPDLAREAWDLLREDIETRSPEQIERMERAQGIARG